MSKEIKSCEGCCFNDKFNDVCTASEEELNFISECTTLDGFPLCGAPPCIGGEVNYD